MQNHSNLTHWTTNASISTAMMDSMQNRVITICILMFLTVFGNALLIIMIMCSPRHRRKRVNIFLFNLAIGDLMVCLFTMTSEILFVAFGEWVLGEVACKLAVYAQIVTLSSATFLLTGMSIDRYQVLARPLRSLSRRPKIWCKVLAAWSAAAIFATPNLLIFVQTEDIDDAGHVTHMCRSRGYTAVWQRKAYILFLTFYVLVIPAAIMSFCYISIIRIVWRRTSNETEDGGTVRFWSSRRRPGMQSRGKTLTVVTPSGRAAAMLTRGRSPNAPNERLILPKKLISASKRKVVKMTLSVIVGFLLCWTPYFVITNIRVWSNYTIKIQTLQGLSEILGMMHSALNPILYGIFSSKFTLNNFLKIITCRRYARYGPRNDETEATEDETSASDARRCSFELRRKRPSLLTSIKGYFPCCNKPESYHVTYDNCTSWEFYHELVPNGNTTNSRTKTHGSVDAYNLAVLSRQRALETQGRHRYSDTVALQSVSRNGTTRTVPYNDLSDVRRNVSTPSCDTSDVRL